MAALVRLEAGMTFARDFRVVKPLAEGGMGAVYVAEQLSTGNLRALKVMHPQVVADPRSRERFAQEARVGSQIRSAHVVEVVAAGVDEDSGTPWLAMELLDGEDIDAHVRRLGPLSLDAARGVFEQLGDALGRAHAAGIVHRDLKPENLFLAASRLRGVAPVVKVLDFGIAKVVAEHQTAATVTSAIGSPLWMAPEQASRGAKVRPATDVWALGLIAFFVLTGRSYWLGANVPEGEFNLSGLLVEIMVSPLEPASARALALQTSAPLPPGFDAWFARCVVRAPEARFADAAQAVDALAPLLGAPPPGPAAQAPHPATQPLPAVHAVTQTAQVAGPPTAAWNHTLAMPHAPPAPPPARSPVAAAALGALVLVVAVTAAVALLRSPAQRVATPTAPASMLPPATVAPSTRPVTAVAEVPAAPPVAAAPDVAAPTEPPRREAPARSPRAPSREREVQGPGQLVVLCRPWCSIAVDGRPVGQSPRTLSLPAGSHRVTCTKGADSRAHSVRVQEGQSARVSCDFT
jgi:tRNA A-37 threonylcarbamoyl transferase component Bud32